MKYRFLLLICAGLTIRPLAEAQTISGTATFNNIGVEVSFGAPLAGGAGIQMFIKKTAEATYREAHPFSRISTTGFAGSAVQLDAGTSYSIRLESAAFATNQYLTVVTRSNTFPDAPNTTYHVSTTGNDGNDGLSVSNALRSLSAGLGKAVAGDKVLLHGGTYYEGDLSAPRSGTPAEPIVICSVPGEAVTLSGLATNFVPAWTVYDAPNGIYRTAYTGVPANAYLNGTHLFRYMVQDELTTNRWDQPGGYFADGAYLYVRFPGKTAPGTNVVTVPARTTGITIDNRSNIHIIGITFCYFGYGQYHRGIYIDGGDSNLVDRCVFNHNGVGVSLKRAADFNTVQNCRFTESPVTTWSWHAVKEGGAGYEAGGIVIYTSSSPNQGNVYRYNTFTNMFDASNLGSDDLAGPTKNMDFHDNVIVGCGDDAVEVDGAGMNNRIYENRFEDFLTGLSVAPCAIGPTYIFRNVFLGWRPVSGFDGYPFKFNVNSSLTIDWVHLYHNTCYTEVPGQYGFLFKQYSLWTNIVSRNNIYAGTDYAFGSWSTSNPVDFDYDNLYTTHGSRFITWNGSSYGSVAAFYAGEGQEQHGVSFEPGFMNTAKKDYRLNYDSRLIDRGVAIPGFNDGYVGVAPDIGAFEFVAKALAISNTAPNIAMTWGVVSGAVYELQYTPSLVAPSWAGLGGAVTTDAITAFWSDLDPQDPRRYYRLRVAE